MVDARTQAGMSAAAESVTESLRRTRQMMIQVTLNFILAYTYVYIIIKQFYMHAYSDNTQGRRSSYLSHFCVVLSLQEVERSAGTLATLGKYSDNCLSGNFVVWMNLMNIVD